MEATALSSRTAQHTSRGGLGAFREASLRQRAPRRAGSLTSVCSHREKRPFARPETTLTGSSALPQSLFSRNTGVTSPGEIPEDNQFLTKKEATCDPEERYCQDPYYVYESECKPCRGTGSVRTPITSRRGARSTLCTCLQCHGLGVVRRTTSRFFPGDDGDKPMTAVRSPPPTPTKKNPTIKRKPPSYYRPRTRPSTNDTAPSGSTSSPESNGAGANGNGTGAATTPDGKAAAAGV